MQGPNRRKSGRGPRRRLLPGTVKEAKLRRSTPQPEKQYGK